VISIDVLPDDVLLAIFDFYVVPRNFLKGQIEMWITLVHVGRRWRNLVFGSPRRLNLRLVYIPGPRTWEMLDDWPALPLLVRPASPLRVKHSSRAADEDHIIAVLKRSDRVRQICFDYLTDSLCEKVWATMQVPFPELALVSLGSNDETTPVVPDSFLGLSAPRLRYMYLEGIPFPGLPKLLSSALCLVDLRLQDIPPSGYISPQAMVTCLSTLTRLEKLRLEFRSPRSHPDREIRSFPPPKRSVLPALINFRFKGVSEYLEDLVTCIDIPKLEDLYIIFFNQIDFDNPQLAQFIKRTPTFKAPDEACVQFHDSTVSIALPSWKSGFGRTLIEISSREPYQCLPSMAQICNSSLPPLSTVENLYVEHHCSRLFGITDVESTQWLELFLPFTGVKNLYISDNFAGGIIRALEGLVEGRMTEILPALQAIFVARSIPRHVWTAIQQFVAARQLSGHPVALSHW
jgi:hypothetical protein